MIEKEDNMPKNDDAKKKLTTGTGGRTGCNSIYSTSIPPSPIQWARISTTLKSSRA
jgi:hypothetical protein